MKLWVGLFHLFHQQILAGTCRFVWSIIMTTIMIMVWRHSSSSCLFFVIHNHKSLSLLFQLGLLYSSMHACYRYSEILSELWFMLSQIYHSSFLTCQHKSEPMVLPQPLKFLYHQVICCFCRGSLSEFLQTIFPRDLLRQLLIFHIIETCKLNLPVRTLFEDPRLLLLVMDHF